MNSVKEIIKETLIKEGVKCEENFELAYKEFMKYFGVGIADEAEELIIEKVKGHTDIKSVPKEVLEMQDLIPAIRSRTEGLLKSVDTIFNNTHNAVLKELEASVLSTMMNDIVFGVKHKPLFNNYREAVNLKKFNRELFSKNFVLERKVEDDKKGLLKKTITNILCATDGESILPQAKEFNLNVEKFCSICRVSFKNSSTIKTISDSGVVTEHTSYTNPEVYNDKPLLLLTRRTVYCLNEEGYIPEEQRFELIIVENK